MEIVLASQSPRRRELLERLGVKNFRIVTPDIDEHMERELPPVPINPAPPVTKYVFIPCFPRIFTIFI